MRAVRAMRIHSQADSTSGALVRKSGSEHGAICYASRMRILHLADLHLGTELYGHYDSTIGSSTRLSDFTRMLDIAVEDAIAKRVDLFLFAGDAYKTRDPSPTRSRGDACSPAHTPGVTSSYQDALSTMRWLKRRTLAIA